jgi:hypothetical protein
MSIYVLYLHYRLLHACPRPMIASAAQCPPGIGKRRTMTKVVLVESAAVAIVQTSIPCSNLGRANEVPCVTVALLSSLKVPIPHALK